MLCSKVREGVNQLVGKREHHLGNFALIFIVVCRPSLLLINSWEWELLRLESVEFCLSCTNWGNERHLLDYAPLWLITIRWGVLNNGKAWGVQIYLWRKIISKGYSHMKCTRFFSTTEEIIGCNKKQEEAFHALFKLWVPSCKAKRVILGRHLFIDDVRRINKCNIHNAS